MVGSKQVPRCSSGAIPSRLSVPSRWFSALWNCAPIRSKLAASAKQGGSAGSVPAQSAPSGGQPSAFVFRHIAGREAANSSAYALVLHSAETSQSHSVSKGDLNGSALARSACFLSCSSTQLLAIGLSSKTPTR